MYTKQCHENVESVTMVYITIHLQFLEINLTIVSIYLSMQLTDRESLSHFL